MTTVTRKVKMYFLSDSLYCIYCTHRIYGFLAANFLAFTMKVMLEGSSLAGYELGARVEASKDLFAGDELLARNGTLGTIVKEYTVSARMMTVQFDSPSDRVIHLRSYQIRLPTLEA